MSFVYFGTGNNSLLHCNIRKHLSFLFCNSKGINAGRHKAEILVIFFYIQKIIAGKLLECPL
jgi:hypothetical protein